MHESEFGCYQAIRQYIDCQDHYWAIIERLYRFSRFTTREKESVDNAIEMISIAKEYLKRFNIKCDGYKVYSFRTIHDKSGKVIVMEDIVYSMGVQLPRDKESYVMSRLNKGRLCTNSLAKRSQRPLSCNGINNRVPYDCKLAHTGAKRREFMV